MTEDKEEAFPASSPSRRSFMGSAVAAGVGLAVSVAAQAFAAAHQNTSEVTTRGPQATKTSGENSMPDAITAEKIRRAQLSGPQSVTKDATVGELDSNGKLTVLRPGTNHWVCIAGNQNVVGAADMCMDPMGMQWMMDVMARKPAPTNKTPGLIYMLNGATQHSYTDPFDRTSPAIPIGPHWMILWPFDAATSGLPTVMRDAGTLIMFAGTPYAHLHICGSPWDGTEYQHGDTATWTMTYARARRT